MELKNKIAICYCCCGPTYRETAKEKLMNLHVDNENLYYFVITDDKEYFSGIKRKNLVVNELKDFYKDYPHLEKYEYFLESESKEDYGKKFVEQGYRFPFSTNRLHFVQAAPYGLTNITMLGTDTDVYIETLDSLLQNDNTIYNSVSRWDQPITENNMMEVVNILSEEYNLKVEPIVRLYDAAAKMFTFESVEFMLNFFKIWDYIMVRIYEEGKVNLFAGSYAVNDEYILGPIYNALGIKGPAKDYRLFNAQHVPHIERFWL